MNDPVVIFDRALRALRAGQPADALPLFERVRELTPDAFEPLAYCAEALGQLERYSDAETLARLAVDMRPDNAEARALLARACLGTAKPDEALDALRHAARLEPHNIEIARALLEQLYPRAHYGEAIRIVETALRLAPRDADLLAKRSAILVGLGRPVEAIDTLKAAMRAVPDEPVLAMSYANMHGYLDHIDGAKVLEAHRLAAAQIERLMGPPFKHPKREAPTPSLGTPGARGPIRVGLLSSDLRRHSVASFARAVIEHLDRREFRVLCLSTWPKQHEDAESAQLRALAGEENWIRCPPSLTGWHAFRASQRALAEQIRALDLHILIDLAGCTLNNNLCTMALRPTAVQATYIGSPHTTGLRAMDFRIVDDITDPPAPAASSPASGTAGTPARASTKTPARAPADRRVSERLVRLPRCFLCFSPPKDLPPITRPPAGIHAPTDPAAGSPVVFGSFNVIIKLNPRCLALWKRVLDAAPASRLLIKAQGLEEPALREELEQRCRRAGIDPERLTILGRVLERQDHLSVYNHIDLALDTTPYCGTTTTCEALVMGVPVVTLAGEVHASRVGASLLTAAGLPELIATSEDEFVALAADLAIDHARRAALRTGLRERVLASSLCDGPDLGRALGTALKAMVGA